MECTDGGQAPPGPPWGGESRKMKICGVFHCSCMVPRHGRKRQAPHEPLHPQQPALADYRQPGPINHLPPLSLHHLRMVPFRMGQSKLPELMDRQIWNDGCPNLITTLSWDPLAKHTRMSDSLG